MDQLKKIKKGVFVVQTTPFNKDGSLDLEGMRANTRWLVERMAGKDFVLVPVGSTGEFYAMSEEENKAVIKMVVEETNGRLPVIAGTGRAGTIDTIKMCRYAESVGADGVQVILPYYHIPEEEGLYQHYKQIAESVNIGVMIYNNSAVSASWIKPPLMARLAKIPNIISVKENTPDVIAYNRMRRTVDPADMVVLCGIGELSFTFEALYGCPGFVSGAANFAPDLSYSIYQAAASRNFDRMCQLGDMIAVYFDFIGKMNASYGPHVGIGSAPAASGYMYIGVIKAAMDILGLRGGEPRLPLIGLKEQDRAELKEILKGMKLL